MAIALSKEFLDFILEQLSELEEIKSKTMMGECITYYLVNRRSQNAN